MSSEGTVRIGKVSAVDEETMRVRVYFYDTQLMSDWLRIVKPFAAVTEETDEETITTSLGGVNTHSHTIPKPQGRAAPSINDTVLCLYRDGFNAAGYVLGVVSV